MLQEGRGWGPVSCPGDEKHHLLSAAEVVDNSSCGNRKPTSCTEGCNLGGGSSVCDLCIIMPESLSCHARASLDTSLRESSGVREGDELLNTCAAAATTIDNGCAEHGLWVDIKLDHAHTIGGLVVVQGSPLVIGDGALPVASTHVV